MRKRRFLVDLPRILPSSAFPVDRPCFRGAAELLGPLRESSFATPHPRRRHNVAIRPSPPERLLIPPTPSRDFAPIATHLAHEATPNGKKEDGRIHGAHRLLLSDWLSSSYLRAPIFPVAGPLHFASELKERSGSRTIAMATGSRLRPPSQSPQEKN